MSYACPIDVTGKKYLFLFFNHSAIGEESDILEDSLRDSFWHYVRPISRRWATKFYDLKEEWERDTAALSSITEIAMHPAYQQIIGMGYDALPFIMTDMQNKPNHWFWALKSITGEDPVLPEQRGRIEEMIKAWLLWWREKQYLI